MTSDDIITVNGPLGNGITGVHLILSPPPVIDVYSGWCGPCKAVVGLFRRVKNEIGDDLLKYAIVRGLHGFQTLGIMERSKHPWVL